MESYKMSLAEIEAELDAINPYWDSVVKRTLPDGAPQRVIRGRPFSNMKSPKIDRFKWLLMRRKQVIDGNVEDGVLIQKDSGKVYSVTVSGSQPQPPDRWSF
jgi:hypothetical protein